MKKSLLLLSVLTLLVFQPAFAEGLLNSRSGADVSASGSGNGLLSGNTAVRANSGAGSDLNRNSGNGAASRADERSFNDENDGESNSSVRNRTAVEDNNVSTRGSTTLDGDIGMPNATAGGNVTSKGSLGVR